MNCPACITAQADVLRGGMFYADCLSCQARGLANSPMAARAMKGDAAELQAAISVVWKDNYCAGRAAVWAWIEQIKKHKAGA